MAQVARKSDKFFTGHLCQFFSTILGCSKDVFVNGVGVARKGDSSQLHLKRFKKYCIPHTASVASGSSTVFVNGKPIARVGDRIETGVILNGSKDVFAG